MSEQAPHHDEQQLSEILRKIRRIEIFTRRMVNELFSGEYHSTFKGQGMEFDEVREYQPGDDVRTIDWNVTARMGSPFIKRFMEERELIVMFLLDVSASGKFGTAEKTKIETAAEICATLAFSAIQNNDKVGAIIFSEDVEDYIPPDKGRRHVLHVIRKLLFHQPKGRGTNIASGLDYLLRVTKRRAIVFVLSDFLSEDFNRSLGLAAKKHDLIAIKISDPRETTLRGGGLVRLWDQERGVEELIDLSRSKVRKRFEHVVANREAELQRSFQRYGIDSIEIDTTQDYARPLSTFFRARSKRR